MNNNADYRNYVDVEVDLMFILMLSMMMKNYEAFLQLLIAVESTVWTNDSTLAEDDDNDDIMIRNGANMNFVVQY